MSAASPLPEWLDPRPWRDLAETADEARVRSALAAQDPGPTDLAALLSRAARGMLEPMAERARALTRRHFGETVTLYVPLYLSNHCSSGCVYCGFASDRLQGRKRLGENEAQREMDSLRARGFDDVLLLTGERCPEADFDYLRQMTALAAQRFSSVSVEAFAMTSAEYAALAESGCTGVTLYQETYDPERYARLHRWGPKQDFRFRLESPSRALEAGIRFAGIGVLLGLADPVSDAVALYRHVRHLQRSHWRGGVMVSFPRICPEAGGFAPPFEVDDIFLAQMIWAFRLCLPEVTLVLSTREGPAFRDGMAGVGINRMSAASRTTVGGYAAPVESGRQFDVKDGRNVEEVCGALRTRGLQPVFKNWDRVLR